MQRGNVVCVIMSYEADDCMTTHLAQILLAQSDKIASEVAEIVYGSQPGSDAENVRTTEKDRVLQTAKQVLERMAAAIRGHQQQLAPSLDTHEMADIVV